MNSYKGIWTGPATSTTAFEGPAKIISVSTETTSAEAIG
jgi:hypothetical protein